MTRVNGPTSGNWVANTASNLMGKVSKKAPIEKLCKKFRENPADALALTTVLSIIAKDGVGCCMYTGQSLTNKNIPEKRRVFVASVDLTNGVLMILAQIGMFFAMRKFSKPIFDKVFQKSFNAEAQKEVITRTRMQQRSDGDIISRKLDITKMLNKIGKENLDLFKFILDIGAATIVGKRIIVPFVATPFANAIQEPMAKMMGIDLHPEASKKTEEVSDLEEQKIERDNDFDDIDDVEDVEDDD